MRSQGAGNEKRNSEKAISNGSPITVAHMNITAVGKQPTQMGTKHFQPSWAPYMIYGPSPTTRWRILTTPVLMPIR